MFVSFIWLIRIQCIHLVTVSLLLIKDLQHIENLSWYIITLSSPYILWNKSLCTQIILGSKWSVCDLLYVHLSVCLSVCILRTVLCHLCDSNPSTLIVARRSAPMGAGILMFVVWNTIYCAFYNLISCSMLIWLWYIYMNRYIGLILYLIHVYSVWTNIETWMTTSFYLPFCFQ